MRGHEPRRKRPLHHVRGSFHWSDGAGISFRYKHSYNLVRYTHTCTAITTTPTAVYLFIYYEVQTLKLLVPTSASRLV